MAESQGIRRFVTPGRILWLMALAGIVVYFMPVRHHHQAPDEDLFVVRHGAPEAASSPFGHPYIRYSIIPGGAHTPQELTRALSSDSVAASHYAGFHVAKARVLTLDSDRKAYVSYRVADKVYWTRRPVTLHKGETLLTDGENYARTRCGNRISDKPGAMAFTEDPTEKALSLTTPVQTTWSVTKTEFGSSDLPLAADLPFEIAGKRITGLPEPLADLESVASEFVPKPPPVVSSYVPTPDEHDKPPIFARDGGLTASTLPVFFPSQTPPISGVPEPGTAALGGLALIGMALLSRRMQKRKSLLSDPSRKA